MRSITLFRLIFGAILFMAANGMYAQTLKVHYGLSGDVANSTVVIDETGNGNNGVLQNGAVISSYNDVPVIDLGGSDGFVNLGDAFGDVFAGLTNYTIFCKVFIPTGTRLNSAGNFVWSFANSNNIANQGTGCAFFSARNGRYAISPTDWTKESGIQTGSALTKGEWTSVTYTEKDGVGRIYLDGALVVSGNITVSPSDLGATGYNYIGRSCYSSDAYLKDAKVADFRVYDGALSEVEVEALSGLVVGSGDTELLAEYRFNNTMSEDGSYTGSVKSGAELIDYANQKVLSLGEDNGYFDFGAGFGNVVASLDSFTISTNVYVSSATSVADNGNFVWTFANSNDILSHANGNMFLSAKTTRYSISETDYRADISVDTKKALAKGAWINLTYTQVEGAGRIYINGEQVTRANVSITPKDLGATSFNYLGRSCYASDSYLKNALYSKFLIYKGAMLGDDIKTLCADLTGLNRYNDSIIVHNAVSKVSLPNGDSVRSRILFPTVVADGVALSWTSNDLGVVANDGTVYRPAFGQAPVVVSLTATLTYGSYSTTTTIDATVLPSYSDKESVAIDASHLKIAGNVNCVRTAVKLPYNTTEGSKVTWRNNAAEYINSVGRVQQLSAVGEGKKEVVFTATISKGDEKVTKDFTVFIAEDDGKDAYLFSYFTGNSPEQEQIRFAISYDGYEYIPLNNGNPVIQSSDIALTSSVRDPHILRGADGKTFYMVVTDMKSNNGWSSNRGMVLLKSTDLVNWTSSTVHFPTKWPVKWGNVLRVWAPQTVYDPLVGKYMVYFSLLSSDDAAPYDKVFYCYANDDFTDLEGEPVFLFDRGSATIDGDIIYNESDSLFHMFFKNEGSGGICKVTTKTLAAEAGKEPGSQWSAASDNLEQTTQAVEGSGVFRLINSDEWVLMYDCYGAGHYQFCNSTDLENFTYVKDNYDMDARHGTTITITAEEANRLVAAFPSTTLNTLTVGARNINIRETGIITDQTAGTVIIPVYYGVDAEAFDPAFYATPGTTIAPQGAQDFSGGSVDYTFTLNGVTTTYKVTLETRVNPILPGFRADPEILYSEKTGQFYLYPTTDGFAGWGGYYFDVFSSPDLVNWSNEGTFLDLSTDQVSWATGNAWAPCIIEKKIGEGDYRYYYYFSGESGGKKIGVAVSDSPTGPFVDSGSPMVSDRPAGVNGGQQIDGDVFKDPVSGKFYFYWG